MLKKKIDLCAYLLPIITSILLLIIENENGYKYFIKLEDLCSLISISYLILEIKLIFFLRAFETFGIYFAIMLVVARKIFSFLLILFLIISSFAHAFLVLLSPSYYSNDPWELTDKYINKKDNPDFTLYREPNEYTNLFLNYKNSLLGMYLFLASK